MSSVPATIGRPSDYSEEIAAEFCRRIALGSSLRTVCASEEMPDEATVYRWRMRHPLFSEQYAHAMAERTETFIEEMLSIADSVDEDPKSRAVRIDTRKWIASKLKPKKYGDLIRQEHSGPGGDSIQINIAPVVHVVTGAPQQAAIEAEIISETKQIEPSKDQ